MLKTQIIWSLILSVKTFQKLKESFEQNCLNLTINLKLKFSTTKHFALKMLLLDQTGRKLSLSFADKLNHKEHSHFYDKKKVKWKWLKLSWVKDKLRWKKRLRKWEEVLFKSKKPQISEFELLKKKKLKLRLNMSWCVIVLKSLRIWFKLLNKKQRSVSAMKSNNVSS